MAAYDSILNVDEWISDHYFTTDETKGESFTKRVKNRTKEWAALDNETGALSPAKRFQQYRGDLQKAFATNANADTTDSLIRTAFGFGAAERKTYARAGEELAYDGWHGNVGTLIVVSAVPAVDSDGGEEDGTNNDVNEDTLISLSVAGGVTPAGKEPQPIKVSKLIGDLFLSQEPPEFIVVIAGTWVLLAERESWPLGRYLAVNLQLAVERNDTKKAGELERIAVILARENLERAADGTTWWAQTREESQQHAMKVSGDLRDAVRESIEIIGNDVLDRRREQDLPIDTIDGNELARQSLRYLYRILFLLFAEASPELAILPTGAPEYVDGYGLDRLRDQILNPPVTDKARRGTHLYDSLQLLFTQVNEGHDPLEAPSADADAQNQGLTFRNLEADLFRHESTALIDEVKLSNAALTQVLQNLLLSKVSAGKDRGFISYATLGVTELGQVYEGLMSYHGFIAQEDLYEVAPKGDASKGSWVLPTHAADTVPQDSFVMETKQMEEGGTSKVRREHPAGSFVFRQSSRDRERSASFYTPQVITEFTVGQAIEVLQEEGRITSSEDVLSLTICEPAMGSGAFAVEAVRQLAGLYLKLREDELDTQVEPEQRTVELQKVKAHIALHQVYGVDLNPTAVELAEISLWLDTMTSQLKAPWFGLHLRRGNSLIGALRSTYSAAQLKKREWLTAVPRREPVQNLAEAIDAGEIRDANAAGRIHQFLLPSATWGAAADAKDLKKLAADEIKAMKAWQKSVTGKAPTKEQSKKLTNLATRVETLWAITLSKMRIAEDQIRRDIDIWGRDAEHTAKNVRREQIERELLHDAEGAYLRLRLIMDAWNALTFWPLTATEQLPDLDEWLATLTDVIGVDTTARDANQIRLASATDWDELVELERTEIGLSGARKIETVMANHPWLETVQSISADQGFFHWDLDFAAVFARGGFDLQVGNPPWVRPRTDLDALYSEADPWFSLAHKPTQAAKNVRREQWNTDPSAREVVYRGLGESVATAAVLTDITRYPHLIGQQPDLYRGFMERTWGNASADGVTSLIHPESHFTEKKAAPLRRGSYLRLRRHWQFINELVLFDVHHLVSYGVHVYGPPQELPSFDHATSLYHPSTVQESFPHDGSGNLPGLKDDNGNWDIRPHRDRIQTVDLKVLEVWHSILEDESVPPIESRMVYTVNNEVAAVLERLAAAPRIRELRLQFSRGWDESIDKKKGYFDTGWAHPDSWGDVILQGPHLGVSTPMIKQPNPTLKHNQDWSEVDLEAMPADFIPATALQPDRKKASYDADYTHYLVGNERIADRDYFRFAWRKMAATTGYRTLYPALLPKRAAISGAAISGTALSNSAGTVLAGAALSSLLSDFVIRATGTANIYAQTVEGVPFAIFEELKPIALEHAQRLNCLTEAYAPLWEELMGEAWDVDKPLRKDEERRAAQVEIDAIVALSLGVTADELCMIYRTQFPVMRRYDQEDRFDANGRKVPKDVMKLQAKLRDGEELPMADRTWVHPQSGVEYVYEYPFRQLDREADMREACARFEGMLH
ncbi:Eco57I restriction-modification methylase domain-containing protein [Corynebacterium appendicis]|uniref:Eco57I restriction-modification methylase domain-containing protein n=1 Tax=Corynebacterium appendicis TaxID=163202 RepID=UPI00254EFB37|nr:DNA methyltransferase [Corynebacterium appendicis]MDK8625693.1 class I SAM-dependent DNA methyltransferase [Corynebacterium appendicis]